MPFQKYGFVVDGFDLKPTGPGFESTKRKHFYKLHIECEYYIKLPFKL